MTVLNIGVIGSSRELITLNIGSWELTVLNIGVIGSSRELITLNIGSFRELTILNKYWSYWFFKGVNHT